MWRNYSDTLHSRSRDFHLILHESKWLIVFEKRCPGVADADASAAMCAVFMTWTHPGVGSAMFVQSTSCFFPPLASPLEFSVGYSQCLLKLKVSSWTAPLHPPTNTWLVSLF